MRGSLTEKEEEEEVVVEEMEVVVVGVRHSSANVAWRCLGGQDSAQHACRSRLRCGRF